MLKKFLKWQTHNPLAVQNTINYMKDFQKVETPILKYWDYPFVPSSSSGQALLLIFASLCQNVDELLLTKWLKQWFLHWNTNLFCLQMIPFLETIEVLKQSKGFSKWMLAKKVPAILRSIGDFLSQNSKIEVWFQKKESVGKAMEELSQSIFYMGKDSVIKPKVRYYFWLLSQASVNYSLSFKDLSLGVNQGMQRWAYFVGPFESGSYTNQELKNSYKEFNKGLRSFVPENLDYHYPLASFQKRDSNNQLICRNIIKGCSNCHLSSSCFLSSDE